MHKNVNKIVRYRHKNMLGVSYWCYGIIIEVLNYYGKKQLWLTELDDVEDIDLNEEFILDEDPCGSGLTEQEVNTLKMNRNYEEVDLEIVGEYKDNRLCFKYLPSLDPVEPDGVTLIR